MDRSHVDRRTIYTTASLVDINMEVTHDGEPDVPCAEENESDASVRRRVLGRRSHV